MIKVFDKSRSEREKLHIIIRFLYLKVHFILPKISRLFATIFPRNEKYTIFFVLDFIKLGI